MYRFLCPRHRNWLLKAPRRAPSFWYAGMRAAQSLIARGRWHEALPHAGSAFEAAQVMVGDPHHCSREWLQRHTASRQLLTMVGEKLSWDAGPAAGDTVH